MKTRAVLVVLFALIALPLPVFAVGGPAPDMDAIHKQFAAKDAEIVQLKAQISELKQEIYQLRQQVISKHAQAIYNRAHPAPDAVYGPVSSFSDSYTYTPPVQVADQPEPQYQPAAPTYSDQESYQNVSDAMSFSSGGFGGASTSPYDMLPTPGAGAPIGQQWSTPGMNQFQSMLYTNSFGLPMGSSHAGYMPGFPSGY